MKLMAAALVAGFCISAGAGFAQDYVTKAKASFIFNGERIRIAPGAPDAGKFIARFASIRGTCDPKCIAPMQAAEGVSTVAEPGVLEFLVKQVGKNTGLLVDARMPVKRAAGYIPGSVSLPYQTVAPNNEFRDDILRALGTRVFEGLYNFADARNLVIYDNGPNQDDAGRLIKNLLEAGYPAHKLHYYRGGMQVWSVLGLSIQEDTL